MIESALFSVLSGSSAITAIAGTRIYLAVLPEDADLPAIVYRFIAGVTSPTMDTRGTQRVRVSIECLAQKDVDAANLRAAVTATLAGYRDANFSAALIGYIDDFDYEALEYRAIVETYLTFSN